MTKSIVRLLLFGLLLCTSFSKAQTVEMIAPSTREISLKIGESPQGLTLRYTNTGSITSAVETVRIGVPSAQKGIYLYAWPSLPPGVTASEDVNRSYIDFTIQPLAPGGTALLIMNIQGGYCYEFQNGTNQVVFTNFLEGVTANNLKLTINKSNSLSQVFSQNKVYRNGDLVSTGSLMTVDANISDVIVREYIYQNASSTDVYNGNAELNGPDINQPVAVTELKVFIEDNSGNRVEALGAVKNFANWTISAPVVVPVNGRLIFQETLVVSGCLFGAVTNIDLFVGVGAWDNCSNAKTNLGPNLNPIKGISFSVDKEKSNFMPDLKCISNGVSSHHKNIVYNYTGATTAFNNTFSLLKYDREAYVVTKNSVKFSLTKKNGVKTTYDIDWSANDFLEGYAPQTMMTYDEFAVAYPAVLTNPDLQKELEALCFGAQHTNSPTVTAIRIAASGRGSYERADPYSQHPFLLNGFVKYGDYLQYNYSSYGANASLYYPFVTSNLPDGLNTEMVFNAQISHYFVNGVSTPITVEPGDVVELEWDEYTSCLNQYSRLGAMGFWPYSHSEDACHNITYAGYGQNSYFGSYPAFIQDPGNSNISGENDRCVYTQDGQIENVSFVYTPNLSQAPEIDNLTGKIIFKVYLDDGLDMDAAFTAPNALGLTRKGYDLNNTCATCEEACTTNVLNQPTYNVKYILANNTALNTTVTRVAVHNDANVGFKLDYLKSPGYNAVQSKAYYLYTIEVDLAQLNLTVSNGASMTGAINDALKDGRLSFDVRCYCPASNPSGKAGIQVISLFDKCETAPAAACEEKYFTRLWPMGYTQFSYQINCPGCKIPGSNINGSSFLRQNVGLVDVNKNGFPDNGDINNPQNGEIAIPANDFVRRTGSEGDRMKASFSVDMSNGVGKSSGLGFLLTELQDDGAILEYLIVKVSVSQSATTYVPATAKAIYHGTTYDVSDYWKDGNTAFFRIPAALVNAQTNLSNGTSVTGFRDADALQFEAEFRLTNLQADNSNIEAVFQAGYSTCATCTNNFYAVSPALSNTDDYDAVLANKDRLFLMCTDGGTYFKGVPFRSERIVFSYDRFGSGEFRNNESGSNCKKIEAIRNWSEFGYVNNFGEHNMYENECRYFFESTMPFSSEITIPVGYEIDRIELFNQVGQARYRLFEQYIIQANQLTNYNTPTQNSFYVTTTTAGNTVLGVRLFYDHESESDAASYRPDNNTFRKDIFSTTLPARLVVKDEYWNTNLFVILKPKTNCTPSVRTAPFPEDHYLTNIPVNPSGDPSIFETATNDLLYSYPYSPYYNHWGPTEIQPDNSYKAFMTKVDAKLEIKNIIDQSLTVNGSVLDLKVNVKEISELFQADYPFLVLEGPALAASKGLVLDGLYWNGYKSTNYPIQYDAANNRILLGMNATYNEFLDGSKPYSFPAIGKSASYNYTIRFNYNCSNITDQGCGGNPVITNGLNHDQLTVRPGYGCSYFPTFAQLDQGLYCGLFDPIAYDISSQIYGSDVKPSFTVAGNTIQHPAPVNLSSCDNFTYNLNLSACQEGPVKGFNVLFNGLPAGLTITGASIGQNSNFTVEQSASNPLAYTISTTDPVNYISIANNNPIIVSFNMSVSCAFETSDFRVSVSGIAACGGNLSANPFVHRLNAAPTAFDDIFINTLLCSTSAIELGYTVSSMSVHNNIMTLTLPAGVHFADDGSSVKTWNIAPGTLGGQGRVFPIVVTGLGIGAVTAEITEYVVVQCGVEEPCEKTKKLVAECILDHSCSITALAGPDQQGCGGSTFTLSADNVQPGFSYTWTGDGNTYSGAVVQVQPSLTTTYTLTVASLSNASCPPTTDEVIVNLASPSVTIVGPDHVCPESSGTLTAQLSGAITGNIQYTWYSTVNGVRALLRGPDNNNSYTHSGLSEETTFEVLVTSTNSACTASDDQIVYIHSLPTINIHAPHEFCIGSTPVVITASPAGGYFDTAPGTGVTLTPSGVYTFHATVAGNYIIRYNYSDPQTGCTASDDDTIVVSSCCKYALKTAEVMCGEDAVRCLTLQAIRPVDDGIKGMDFTLRYERALMRPTGIPGRGNATIGNVVLNSGMTGGMANYSMTERTVAGTTLNELHVSIFYTGQAPSAADFDGIGDVICIEFKILGAATSGLGGQTKPYWIGDIYQGQFSQGVVDDEHKVLLVRSCVENNGEGVISILKNNFLTGKIYYHNDVNAPLRYDAATNPTPYLITTIKPITTGWASTLCDPTTIAAKTTDLNGAFTVDMTGGNGLKIQRDITGDYYNSCTSTADVIDESGNVHRANDPADLLLAINGYDTYLMESITTLRNSSDVVYVTDRKVPGVIGNTALQINQAAALFPTPFQIIAGDVNMDRMVRAVDITMVQERAVSKLCEYPQVWNYNLGVDPSVYPLNSTDQRSLDWRFIDKSQIGTNLSYRKHTSYPYGGGTGTGAAGYWRDNVPYPPLCLMGPSANPNTCKSYATAFEIHAIMLGDMDGSWRANTNNSQKNLRVASSDRQVILKVRSKEQISANTYRIPVSFVSLDPETVSLDFALDYNEEELSVKAVGNLAAADAAGAKVVFNDFEKKQLLFTSYTMTGFNPSTPIYYIDVTAKNGELDPNALGFGSAYLNGEKVELVVEGRTITGTQQEGSGAEYGFNVYPNPTNNDGEITYHIKSGTEARIVVYNTLGQVVSEQNNLKGKGTIEMSTSEWSSGMYNVILYTEGAEQLVKKWVIQK